MGLVEFRSFENALHPCSNAILSANKYIRKLKGESQTVFVRANDGNYYFVKMADNPSGPNLLANEHMGSRLAKAVGLPVPETKGILFSDSFIDSHPDLWFELPSEVRRPNKGVHFGSLLVGQTSGPERPTEYISPSGIDRIANREAFLGMYLFDVWANHRASRHAIFKRQDNNTLKAFFINHGHIFGGSKWDLDDSPVAPLHMEAAIYSGLWQDELVDRWTSIFQSVIPEVLSTVPQSMGSEWYKGDLVELIERLTDRLAKLPDFIREAGKGNSWPFQERTCESLTAPDALRAQGGVYRSRATA